MAQVIDYAAYTRTKPTYDLSGRLVSVKEYDGSALTNNTVRSQHTYTYADKTNYLVKKESILPTKTVTAEYTYGDAALGQMPDHIYKIVNKAGWAELLYTYDALGRVTSEEIDVSVNPSLVSTYTYKDVDSARTTSLVSSHSNKLGTYAYTYDSVGNITSFTFTPAGSGQAKSVYYTYNSSNQLTREDNQFANKTYLYFVTSTGNISSIQETAYTAPGTTPSNRQTVTDMAYDDWVWSDRVTEINGDAVIYDAIGNPLTYRGNTFTWQKGRQLATVSGNGNSISYQYGADGLRTKKLVNGTTTEYTYASGLLVSQSDPTATLNFTYSADGIPRTVTYAGAQYYYLYNLQGDVIGIYNSQGSQVVSYTYDTWGKLVSVSGSLASTLGAKNPFRYRGYVYDTETGYYYLTTRYYDPETGRFLNADGYISTGETLTGYNMFAYCYNNPVNMEDSEGNRPIASTSVQNEEKTDRIASLEYMNNSKQTSVSIALSASNLPHTGEPGSSRSLHNPDGTIKQKRWYGPDGKPVRDRDYNHPGEDIPFPHDHEWKDGQRQKDHLSPSPDYDFSLNPALGIGLVTVCTVGIIIITFDDVTGFGVVDNFLISPFSAGVAGGLSMIFG